MISRAQAGSTTSPRGRKPFRTGFISSTGVPSMASRPRTVSLNPVTDALRRSAIKWVDVRHEESGAFAAGADIGEMAGASVIDMLERNQFAKWDRIRKLGKPLIAADHPLAGAGVNSNIGNQDLNEASLEAAMIQMASWSDDRGLMISVQPMKLVVPPQLAMTAARLLESEYRPGTADNDINVFTTNGVLPKGFVVNHFLTDPDAWFIITDLPNGLKMFQRTPLKNQTEGDFDTGNLRYKSRERYSFGFSDPLAIWGSPGAP